MHSSVGIATHPWSRPPPDPRGAGFRSRCAARTVFAASSPLSARVAKAALQLLALSLLWLSTEASAERDVTIERDADKIRIDARLRVDVHHHIAWQVLTDYDNLARFEIGRASCRERVW